MSQTPDPARKVGALVDILVDLDHSEILDDLVLARLERDARALMQSDPAGARSVLGGVASLHCDTAGVREHYQVALRLSGRDSEVLANYATALTKVGEMDEAFDAIMEACERRPDDPSILQGAIDIAMQGARFGESRTLYERRTRLKPEDPGDDEFQVNALTEAIDRSAFRECAARQVVALAHEIRRDAGIRYSASGPVALYGEPDRFGFDVHVHATPGVAAHLNEVLADRIVADDALMRGLALNFVPTFIGTRTNGGDTTGTT